MNVLLMNAISRHLRAGGRIQFLALDNIPEYSKELQRRLGAKFCIHDNPDCDADFTLCEQCEEARRRLREECEREELERINEFEIARALWEGYGDYS